MKRLIISLVFAIAAFAAEAQTKYQAYEMGFVGEKKDTHEWYLGKAYPRDIRVVAQHNTYIIYESHETISLTVKGQPESVKNPNGFEMRYSDVIDSDYMPCKLSVISTFDKPDDILVVVFYPRQSVIKGFWYRMRLSK